jgi:hypothetical protein
MINNCLFYDKTLNKTVPCFLIPNQVYTTNHRKFVNISLDPSKFTEYNTNIQELVRYSSFTIRLIDLYPNTTPQELAYAQSCIPNIVPNLTTFYYDELVRFKKIVDMVLNTNSITSDTFYKLADFLSYEVLFLFLQANERKFMLTIATIPLTSGNVAAVIAANGGINNIKPYLQTCLKLFTSYAYTDNNYYIQNIMNLASTGVTFPLVINVPLLQSNLQFLQDNGYLN